MVEFLWIRWSGDDDDDEILLVLDINIQFKVMPIPDENSY